MSSRRPTVISASGAPPADDEIEILEIVGLDDDAPPLGALAEDDDADDSVVFEEPIHSHDPSRGLPHDVVDRGQFLRLQADFENFKKRVERDRESLRVQAAGDLITRLLPVLDNFERAISSAPKNDEERRFLEGVGLIFRQLLDELRKDGLAAIETLGQPFDPTLHEAVATDAASGLPSNTIVEEVERGYCLQGQLIRPAKVKVAVDRAGTTSSSSGDHEVN